MEEIIDELKDRIYTNQIIIKENKNNFIINVLFPQNKELIFELKSIIKNNKERFND